MYEDVAVSRQLGSIYRHWAKKGIGTQVKSSRSRKSVKVLGMVPVDTNPKRHFGFAKVVNNHSFLVPLTQLLRQCRGGMIHLFANNAKYRKTMEVTNRVEKNSAKIELQLLRNYSSELNAAEYVWRKHGEKVLISASCPQSTFSDKNCSGGSTAFKEIQHR